MESKADKIEFLNRLARAQDRQAQDRDLRHIERVAEVVETMIENRAASIAEPLSILAAARLQRLAVRLTALDLLDLDEDGDGHIGFIADGSGQMIPSICPDGDLTYSEHGERLIVQREHGGRLQYAEVGEDGVFSDWRDAPPPPPTASNN